MKFCRSFSLTQLARKNEELDPNKPYSYLKSDAFKWPAKESRQPYENKPEWQGYVISLSMAIFMIYFFILREESDVDKVFDRDLRSYFSEMSDKEFNSVMQSKVK